MRPGSMVDEGGGGGLADLGVVVNGGVGVGGLRGSHAEEEDHTATNGFGFGFG